MQSSFAEAVDAAEAEPGRRPAHRADQHCGPGEDLKYRAVFEVFPEIELKGVDGLAVTRPVAEVTEADVDAMVENLREQRPTFATVERESRDGDRVTMDFDGHDRRRRRSRAARATTSP